MKKRKKFLLCPNPERDIQLELTKKVYRMLQEMGEEAVICPVMGVYRNAELEASGMGISDIHTELENTKMIITFGGDGTILHVARMAAACGIPILGINKGTLGFMAELEKHDLELIRSAVSGKYRLDKRMMLDVIVQRDGKDIYSDFALNDVVIGGIARIIHLTIQGDGRTITEFSGDGLVVATPTGSTAYSMSAGGPIVEPDAENILVTPICAHALIAKSFVLAPDRCVTVTMGPLRGKRAYVATDGGASVSLESGDMIRIVKSKCMTKLVSVTERSFYERVSEKLGERR